MKRLWRYVILIFVLAIFAAATLIAYDAILGYIEKKYSPNQQMEEYYSEGYTDLVINFVKTDYEYPVRIVNGEILVRYEVIKEYIDPFIYYDETRAKVIITTNDKVIYITENSLIAELNKKIFTLILQV